VLSSLLLPRALRSAACGFSGLAFCLFLGPRKFVGDHKPSSLANVFLGTGMLWFGWLFFNAGSELAINGRAAVAAFNTVLAGSVGGLLWVFIDLIVLRKMSGLSFCSGCVAGLACVTPAAGFVAPWAALVIGLCGTVVAFFCVRLKGALRFDDTLDVWCVHGMCGVAGLFLTGIFADSSVIQLDGSTIPGGAIDGNGIQMGYQMVAIVSISAWAFVVTWILIFLINRIPGMTLRSSVEQELYGHDEGEMGEIVHQHLAGNVDQNWQQGYPVGAVDKAPHQPVPNPRLRLSKKHANEPAEQPL
jgi:Amt family ammonium transporter